jgi:hypothetical protein
MAGGPAASQRPGHGYDNDKLPDFDLPPLEEFLKDYAPTSPSEGPPLPKKLKIRWPWRKKENG